MSGIGYLFAAGGQCLLFALHMAATGLGATLPAVCIPLRFVRGRTESAAADHAGRRLALWSLYFTSLGLLVGILILPLLAYLGDRGYFEALSQLTARRYAYAAAELLFYYLCMIPYILLWDRMAHHRIWHSSLALLASTNLLYHFPPLMVMLAVLSHRPQLAGITLDGAAYHKLLTDPEVISHTFHWWVMSVLLAGVALVGHGLRAGHGGKATQIDRQLAVWGARLALAAALVQIPVGVWLLRRLPTAVRQAMTGDDLWATGLFIAALTVMLALIHRLAAIALGDVGPRSMARSLLLSGALVVLMCSAQQRASGVLTGTRTRPRTPSEGIVEQKQQKDSWIETIGDIHKRLAASDVRNHP